MWGVIFAVRRQRSQTLENQKKTLRINHMEKQTRKQQYEKYGMIRISYDSTRVSRRRTAFLLQGRFPSNSGWFVPPRATFAQWNRVSPQQLYTA